MGTVIAFYHVDNAELLSGYRGFTLYQHPGTQDEPRLFVDAVLYRAVLYRYRAGIPWRDLPERFGDYRVVQTRFSRWSKSGVWERIFTCLAGDADNEYAMIDSTIVRAHQHSAGAPKKTGTTKRSHAVKVA